MSEAAWYLLTALMGITWTVSAICVLSYAVFVVLLVARFFIHLPKAIPRLFVSPLKLFPYEWVRILEPDGTTSIMIRAFLVLIVAIVCFALGAVSLHVRDLL